MRKWLNWWYVKYRLHAELLYIWWTLTGKKIRLDLPRKPDA